MKKIAKKILLTLTIFSLFIMISCDDFPAFEGSYYGTLTKVLHPSDDFPEETTCNVEITRSFKDITIIYTYENRYFSLTGTIDKQGNFIVENTLIYNGVTIVTQDSGTITYSTGKYISTLTESNDGVEIMRLELDLQKLFD
ncbi:MAG: hypothetical protein JW737_02520 [Acidobacteria bacterium]|nr:hypothetical protein [Acidobacteriota bacterium]